LRLGENCDRPDRIDKIGQTKKCISVPC
jgi:hypothetical protein